MSRQDRAIRETGISALACSLVPTLLHHFNRQPRRFIGHFVLIFPALLRR